MIGLIQGKLIHKNPETQQGIILAGPVGYEVYFSRNHLERAPLETEGTHWIHTHVREDTLTLFAFPTEEERYLFRVLLSVSGLGPKTALSLLGEHGAEKLVHYVLTKQTGAISEAPGVGKKLAERIAMELAPKLEKLSLSKKLVTSTTTTTKIEQSPLEVVKQDLFSALTNLGYAPQQVKIAVERVVDTESNQFAFEKLLKAALKEISGRTLSS